MPVPFNFQWFRWRSPEWWQAVRDKAYSERISVNKLIIELIDLWLKGRIIKIKK